MTSRSGTKKVNSCLPQSFSAEELLKHARVVPIDEVQENDFNLNIPRYVDTFEPEPRIEVESYFIDGLRLGGLGNELGTSVRRLS